MKIKKPTIAAMDTKRKATTDLNHENWDRAEEPEDRGTFQAAPEEVLKRRVIKKARRNLGTTEAGETKSVFSGFSGFGGLTSQSLSSSPFSFLSKITPQPPPYVGSTAAAKETTDAPAPKTAPENAEKPEKKDESKFGFEKSNTYYSKLTSLNKAVSDWIKTHVDKNPLCILSPIFKDYEKYLKEIQDDHPEGAISSTASSTTDKFDGTGKTGQVKQAEKDKEIDKPPVPQFSFGAVNSTTDSKGAKNSKQSIFGNNLSAKDSAMSTFSFKSTPSTVEASSSKSSIFSSASSTSADTSAASSATGFTFSSAKPFMFGSSVTAVPSDTASKVSEEAEEEDEPPKVEFTPVVEEDYVYSKRCKVFVKTDGNYSDRGVGTLYLKPVKDKDKTQLIVRADTNLGNILLNFILNESIPAQRLGKNNVMMVCVPTPDSDLTKPTSILLRVKTGEEADELLNTIDKYKK